MMKKAHFEDVLDAATGLSIDAREELVEILNKRMIEERRTELAKDIKSARNDYKNNRCKVSSVNDIMKAIVS